MFHWWRQARRRRLLAAREPSELREQLRQHVWQWRYLPKDVADAAIDWLRIFEAEKHWETSRGFVLEPHHRWLIAAQASLMTLAFPEWYFDRSQTMLIRPTDYVAPGITHMVNEQIGIHGHQARSGQTSYRGPVVLNWSAVEAAGRDYNDGHSLTVHELAHQLDFDNGPAIDGVPPLPAHVNVDRWQHDLNDQLKELREAVGLGYDVLVDEYGLTSSSEFFAVSSELYFQLPHELAELHPKLFQLLLACYQRDWRQWLPRY